MGGKYRFLLSVASVALILAVALYVLPVNGEAGIYDGVLRLHVLANSDSESDQAIKLKVRDAVIEAVAGITAEAGSVDEAVALANEAIGDIETAANAVLMREGVNYRATATISRESYPTREYEGYSLPAGIYMSLRVILGGGGGANWWCILFPDICVSAALKHIAPDKAAVMTSLTPEQYKIITESDGRYIVKFKLLEILSAMMKQFGSAELK